jgi:1-acyl-sn-glycerol-3-phosphate acyltransferase
VRQWPLAGWLAQAVGTVFIERGRRHAVTHVNHELVRRLKQGRQIGIFPEGTTTDGSVLLRFHSNLVHAAVAAGVDVVPVALCYLQNNRPSVVPAYIGEMTLAQSVWQMLLAPGLGAKVSFLQPMATVEATRQDLADHAYQAIAQTLGVDQSRLPGDLA